MNKSIAVIVGIGLLGAGTHVLAGARLTSNVVVTSTMFSGSIAQARASSDSRQQIGCSLTANTAGGSFGGCSAMDAAGNTKSCTFDSRVMPQFAQAVAIMSSNSFISVWFNPDGTCSGVRISNASTYPGIGQ